MRHKITVQHRGAELTLAFDATPSAVLTVNGIEREDAHSDLSNVTLRLTSTVQTDYEWHEFIEGIVEYTTDSITARLLANKQELLVERVPRENS